jgi:hypothetical protein
VGLKFNKLPPGAGGGGGNYVPVHLPETRSILGGIGQAISNPPTPGSAIAAAGTVPATGIGWYSSNFAVAGSTPPPSGSYPVSGGGQGIAGLAPPTPDPVVSPGSWGRPGYT